MVLAGFFAFMRLPVAPLPQVDYPTITVSALMPGASPETMAATVATPLEHHLGVIADVAEMSSESTVGRTNITLQFSLNRNLDGAADLSLQDGYELATSNPRNGRGDYERKHHEDDTRVGDASFPFAALHCDQARLGRG